MNLPNSIAVYQPGTYYPPSPRVIDIGTAREVLSRMGCKMKSPRQRNFVEKAKDQICIRIGEVVACYSNRDFLELSLKFLKEHE